MSLHLQFSEADWERTRRDWTAWWAGELDRPLVVLECIEPENRYELHCSSVFLGNYPMETPTDILLNEFVPRLENTVYLGDSFPRFWPNFGPGIVAAFAGAEVHPAWDTTWFTPAQPVVTLEKMRVANKLSIVDNNPWWKRVVAITQAAVDHWGQDLAVGITDLGGNLDVLASLRGTRQLLMDLVKSPEEVDRLVRETTALWLECYTRLYALINRAKRGITCWGPCWSDGRSYMLQSDFSYMISPQMFERFVLPDLDVCCLAMDHAFYHLDGKGQLVHVDALLSIPRLRGIQWVPGFGKPPCEDWLPLLKKIRTAGKLCQVTVSPEGALKIIKETGGKGFAFVIDEPQLTPAKGKAFLEELSKWTNS